MIRDNILNAAILFVVFTASLTAAFAIEPVGVGV